MTLYEIARPGDEEEILDFANLVFSQAYRPHDFRALLPKVYAKKEFADYHVVARQNGRICALVGVWPMTFRVMEGIDLKLGYVGTVSVHSYHRGEGHMQKLMPMAIERSRQAGIDLMSLGGQRQRYRYFGFEQGGQRLSFDVTATNMRHDFPHVDTSRYTFSKLSEEDSTMDKARALYARECLTGQRDGAAFAEALTSWEGKAIAIKQDGEFVGYFYTVGDSISEWLLTDLALLGPVLKAYLKCSGLEQVRISVPGHEPERIRALDAFAERCSLSNAGMHCVLNWPRVLSALMTFKKERFGLNPGTADMAIEGEGAYRITVTDKGVDVVQIENTEVPALTPIQAVGLVFSLPNRMGRTQDAWNDWFPLPLNVPQPDCF